MRDQLLRKPVNDWDLEVYGLTEAELAEVIARFGSVKKVGGHFGVFVMQGIELALPQGPGFRLASDMATQKACRRRDFTINAMLWDPIQGDLLDYHGGREDLARGVLRLTDPETFVEDPLRVLRAARLAGQLGMRIAPETAAACRALAPALDDLPWERIQKELVAWLLRSGWPGRTWDALVETGAIGLFPSFRGLQGVPWQDGPGLAGDAWTHSGRVLDAAAGLRQGNRSRDLILMLAALLQDLGRPDRGRYEVRGRWQASGHEAVAVTRARHFLQRWFPSQSLQGAILPLVRWQAAPQELHGRQAGKTAYLRLALRLPDRRLFLDFVRMLTHVAGISCQAIDQTQAIWSAAGLLDGQPEPWIRGDDIKGMGLSPGPDFRRWLEMAYRLQLSGRYPDRNTLLQRLLHIRKRPISSHAS
ncbi:CCA tRNA nucleotidyltransferase [Thermithiobacillus plumbiphilus]|uniref:CCA tRNA nucleotidyltransferase n=1 Tax=Thermithiobacillus plumbiphilus TaxID=1729899 RepID=A0ABU9D5V5_9PROT